MRGYKAFVHGMAALGVSGTALYAQQPLFPNFHHKPGGQAETAMPPIPSLPGTVLPGNAMPPIPCLPGTVMPGTPSPGNAMPPVPTLPGTVMPPGPGQTTPATPGTAPPTTPGSTTPTNTNPAPVPAAGNAGNNLAAAELASTSAGSAGRGSVSSLFGDVFGGSQNQLTRTLGRLQVFVGNVQLGAVTPGGQPLTATRPGSTVSTIQIVGAYPAQLNTLQNSQVKTLQNFTNTTATFTTRNTIDAVNAQLAAANQPPRIAIVDNAGYQQNATTTFQDQFKRNTGAKAVFISADGAANGLASYAQFQSGRAGAAALHTGDSYDAIYTYEYQQSNNVPAVQVGRTKLSDDNSPLPRDRVIFNFDYFSNTRLSTNRVDVYRFSPGFEKTFLDQRASVEVRLPFASTLSNNLLNDNSVTADRVLLGDLFFNFKGLLYSDPVWNFAAGVGFSLPTGPDVNVRDAFSPIPGDSYLRLVNETVNVVPYIAGVFTPNERFFLQSWMSQSYDISGSPVFANVDGTGLSKIGRLYDQSVFSIDGQMGYWLIPPGTGTGVLSGFAPFLEAHYNTTTDNASRARTADGAFDVASQGNRYDEINMSAGVNMVFQNNISCMVGVAVPVRRHDNQFFDYQIGVRLNWFYGATAEKATNSATRIQGF